VGCSWGPSEARCAPLVWLLLLSDPGSWCSGTRKHLRHLPGLCSAHGGIAGLEQRGVEQRESPHWRCRWGPSQARCAPLVRLLLLSDPGSWCSGTGRPGKAPYFFSARWRRWARAERGVEQHDNPRGQLKRGEMGPKATIFGSSTCGTRS
jgi:hypothetical protein